MIDKRNLKQTLDRLLAYAERRLGRGILASVDVNCGFYDKQSQLLGEFTAKAFGGHPFCRYSSACVPDLSIDAYNVCSLDIYQKWGPEQHKRIVERYRGARLHIHGDGRRHCELASKIEALTSCLMFDDQSQKERL